MLRQKTKNFIINHCISRQKSTEQSLDSRKKKPDPYYSPKVKKGFNNITNENNSVVYKNKKIDEVIISKNKNVKKKRFFSIDNANLISPIKRIKTNDFSKFKKRRFSNIYKNKMNKTILNYSNISQDEKKALKRSTLHKSISEYDDENDNFYNRVKTFRNRPKGKIREKDRERERETSPISKKLNLEERISQNIENNKQNLNNPEEYFSGFFKNILSKKKSQKNLKLLNINKDQKKIQTIYYKNKKDIKQKTKNGNFDFEGLYYLKRNSTVNDNIENLDATFKI